MEKMDARSLSTDTQQQLRYQAIRLREDGRTYDEIALVVGVHPSTIASWWQAYQKQGMVGIEIKKRGRRLGQGRRLDAKQEDQLRRLLIDKTPDQLKLPFALMDPPRRAGFGSASMVDRAADPDGGGLFEALWLYAAKATQARL